ncbi:MAG: hypothetical protein QM811_19535 [Pirellulales bacterium]
MRVGSRRGVIEHQFCERGLTNSSITIVCKISDGQRTLHTARLSRAVEIGRREPHEPLPFALIHREEDDRLILVDVAERSVSRRHFRFEPTSPTKVIIHNLSKNTIHLSAGANWRPTSGPKSRCR